MFHTNLAAGINTGGPFRVGIGLSQIAELLLAAIEHLKNDNAIKQVIVEKHFKASLDEAKDLEQDLQILNTGQGSQKTDATALGFNRFRAAAAAQSGSGRNFSDDDVRKAARKFHEWLSKEKTPAPRFAGNHGCTRCLLCGTRWREAGCTTSRPPLKPHKKP